MTTLHAHRPIWIFDRADRLAALAVRSDEIAEALRRQRCDAIRDRASTARLDARIAAHRDRFHRLAACARRARHAARMALRSAPAAP